MEWDGGVLLFLVCGEIRFFLCILGCGEKLRGVWKGEGEGAEGGGGGIGEMDTHTYVKVAYHGFKLLSKDEKIATYGNTLVRDAFDEPDYALIDTLFSLVEVYLFAQLV
ncbi:5'-nucleotidase domain-containing protein 4 isoform X3 [Tanacetum coccineum]